MNQKELTAHGVYTPVIDQGEGQAVVFVNGVPDSGRVWRRLMDRMDSCYRLIAPDLHGIGRSIAPADFDLSLESRAAWLEEVLTELDISGPVDLVCHDFGGPTTLAWAVLQPERVRSLTVMATCFHRQWQWHALGRAYRIPLVGELMMKFQTMPWLGYRLFVQEMRKGSDALDDEFLRDCYANAVAGDPNFIVRLYRDTPAEIFAGWDEKLYALVEQRPTLCIWGGHDPYVPLQFAEKLGARGAQVHRFADAGHWTMIEKCNEVARLLSQFLEQQPSLPGPNL
ncbi:MAG: alpha/beta fold hydrolase [Candidatus Latescibacteria bacterium]|nr:alpha/beta fold hydrolase [Candidatus Latescibacterota bacterium]